VSEILSRACVSGAIILVWIATVAAMYGTGIITVVALGCAATKLRPRREVLWLGVCSTISILQLCHFVRPIDGTVVGILACIGVMGLVSARHSCCVWQRVAFSRHRGVLVVWLLFLVIAAYRASGPCRWFDTWQYHLMAARWNSAFAVVPGLANLNGPLGYCGSGLLYAAVFNVVPIGDAPASLALGPLLLCLMFDGLWAAASCSSGRRLGYKAARACFVPYACAIVSGEQFPSMSTDVLATVVMLAVFPTFMRLMTYRALKTRWCLWAFPFLGICCAVAVAFKLTTVPCATAMLLAAGIRVAQYTHVRHSARIFGWSVAAISVVIVPWLVRTMILTGYPLFPLQVCPLPVEWRVPAEQAEAIRAWHAFYTHYHRERAFYSRPTELVIQRGSWRSWLGGLAKGGLADLCLPLAWACGALAVGLLRRWRHGLRDERLRGAALPIAVCLPLLLIMMPEPRYTAFMSWGLAAIGTAFAFVPGRGMGSYRYAVGVQLTVAWASLLSSAAGALDGCSSASSGAATWDPNYVRCIEQGSAGVETAVYTTDSGLRLNVPRLPTLLCGDAPLPCTPYPAHNLRLRQNGDLASGFVVDGRWSPERWPHPMSQFLSYWRGYTSR
jgi:hypothetical protein